jgi:hypothetical protein
VLVQVGKQQVGKGDAAAAGANAVCRLLAARAALVALPGQAQGGAAASGAARRCLLVELVGDRFLRRMVRASPPPG